MTKLKVLVFDIETAPMTAYVWGRHDVNIALGNIQKDWSIIAWSAKWLGSPASSIIYYDQRNAKNIEDDKAILKPLWELLDEADIVVTQNGKNFDSKMLNARFISHCWAPPSPYRHLDTYQIVRRVAKFTSNKLEYLTEKLCVRYKKLSHTKFPGMLLWSECLAGNKAAWREMQRYNIHDTLATEELYEKVKAWAPASTPVFYVKDTSTECHRCGSNDKMRRKGREMTKRGLMQKYQCQGCGAWTQGKARIR